MYKVVKKKEAAFLDNLLLIYSVPEAGIEPAQHCCYWILSPARLPIPPLRQALIRLISKVVQI